MLPIARIAALLLAPALVAGFSVAPASADAVPPVGDNWPACGAAPDTNGKYCIVSLSRNGAEVPPVDQSTLGEYYKGTVSLVDTGALAYRVDKTIVADFGGTLDYYDDQRLEPGDTFELVLNTGAVNPREMYGDLHDPNFSVAGSPTTGGYVLTIHASPAPVSRTYSVTCSYDEGCGDDTTAADYDQGQLNGIVTDDENAGWSAAQIAQRVGFVSATNVQDGTVGAGPEGLDFRVANVHLQSDGVTPFSGYYQAFVPDVMLNRTLGIVDPTTVTGETLVVTRDGSDVAPAATVTRVDGGVAIDITGIAGPTARFLATPVPTAPGAPRAAKFKRPTATSARITFAAPWANGSSEIEKYQAACRKGTGAWHPGSRFASPITISKLPTGALTCHVRAVNAVGTGPWAVAKPS